MEGEGFGDPSIFLGAKKQMRDGYCRQGQGRGVKGGSVEKGTAGWVLKDEWELAEDGAGAREDAGQRPSRQKNSVSKGTEA